MTSEEEEEAPEDDDHEAPCPRWGEGEPHNPHVWDAPEGGTSFCPGWESPPPQPERRPPYVVVYSVQGHLFEVALPGDASVQAIDGALLIQHHLGPVAGIVRVLPVINKGEE